MSAKAEQERQQRVVSAGKSQQRERSLAAAIAGSVPNRVGGGADREVDQRGVATQTLLPLRRDCFRTSTCLIDGRAERRRQPPVARPERGPRPPRY